LAAKAPTTKGQHPCKSQFPTSNKAFVILIPQTREKDLWHFLVIAELNIQKHLEMFRFTQHDAKAIVILSEAKDLGNFPCAHRLNIQRQSEMFRFAQHDRMARLFEN
jgi:hypothetical protein